MKQIFSTLLFLVVSMVAFAQNNVTGTIVDRDTKEPMEQTAVQLSVSYTHLTLPTNREV